MEYGSFIDISPSSFQFNIIIFQPYCRYDNILKNISIVQYTIRALN